MITTDDEQVVQLTDNGVGDSLTDKNSELLRNQDGMGYHSLTRMADERPSEEGEIESDKQGESNLSDENMIMIEKYFQKAAYYAELWHEPKFHIFLKLAKFLGHITKSTVNK